MIKDSFIIEIEKEKLINNYTYLLKKSGKQMIAVVKANAYGLGIKEVVTILSGIGCKYFAVSRVSEIEEILALKIENIKILMLETLESFELLKNSKDIEIIVTDLKMLKEALNLGVDPLQIHLRLDFGFARSGFKVDEIEELKDYIKKNDLKFKGIMGHLFSAKEKDMKEISLKFTQIVEEIGKERFTTIHLLNSEAVEKIECEIATHIRCGQYLLGFKNRECENKNVQKIFRLKGRVFDLIEVDGLEYIGYCEIERLKLTNLGRIGQLKIGYGDGFLKDYEGIEILINDKRYKIIHISMDISFVEVDKNVKNGDLVEIFFDLTSIEERYRKTSYEILSTLNNRIEKIIV